MGGVGGVVGVLKNEQGQTKGDGGCQNSGVLNERTF